MHLTRALRFGAVACIAGTASAAIPYSVTDTFDASNFFSSFDFFDGGDPTHGAVKYNNAAIANTSALAGYAQDAIYVGVDYTTKNPDGGRQSVRLESKKEFTQGLIIADIAHMPKQVCGSWPAFWTANTADWPASGEIDIIEGVNLQDANSVTLHTADGCTMNNAASPGTVMASENCNEQSGYTGCGQKTQNAQNYGNSFNSNNGGVYALDWTVEHINVYFFPRSAIPADITAGLPDPSTWGTPTASFTGSCDIDNHFKNHKIIINTTFCGDWAGAVWGDQCGALAPTCEQYVAENPEAFAEAYWLFNSIKVYKQVATGTAQAKRGLTSRPFMA